MIGVVGQDGTSDGCERPLHVRIHFFELLHLFFKGFLSKQKVELECFLVGFFEGSQKSTFILLEAYAEGILSEFKLNIIGLRVDM